MSAGEVADGDAGDGLELEAPGLAMPLVLELLELGVADDGPLIEPDELPDIEPLLLESVGVVDPVLDVIPAVEGLVDDEDDELDGDDLDAAELLLGLLLGVEVLEDDDDGVVSGRLQP